MKVEFTLGNLDPFNVVTMDYFGYRDLIENLRRRLEVTRSHGRPVLAVQQNPPTLFFDLILRTNNRSVRFRFQSDNLYLLGYVPVDENNIQLNPWLEFKPRKKGHSVHLIAEQGTNFLGFEGSYFALENAAGQRIEKMTVGVHGLVDAIDKLAVAGVGQLEQENKKKVGQSEQEKEKVKQDRARSLVVVIMMISEATRLIPVFDYMAQGFDNNPGTSRATERRIQPWIRELVHAWEDMSGALLHDDAFPGQPFQFLQDNRLKIPPSNVPNIRTIEQATKVLGILLTTPTGERIRFHMARMETPLEDFSEQIKIGVAAFLSWLLCGFKGIIVFFIVFLLIWVR